MKTIPFKYPIEVFWSQEDEGYIALVPDLPGCSAWGESIDDASAQAQEAAKAWLKAAKSMKRAIPKPSIDSNFSGKFLMRLPKRLHAELARAAKAEGVSLNQYLLYLLVQQNTAHGMISA
jgi:antitoxin HicB